jgi:hypothetical protein
MDGGRGRKSKSEKKESKKRDMGLATIQFFFNKE